MALARTYSVALVGVHGHVIEVEADIANGLVGMVLVGLPDTALREARDRIRAAILNSGEQWPQRRITVGLSPASLPKRGSGFDLPIAIALLAASGVLKAAVLAGMMFLGELGLDGQLRPVRGVLPAAVAAAAAGFRQVVVARANAQEAALVPGLRVLAAPTLAALLARMRGEPPGPAGGAVEELTGGTITSLPGAAAPVPGGDAQAGPPAAGRTPSPDLSDVLGQPLARRAAEICAAGGHHLSLLGPPGAGKTMIAERLPTILPRLDAEAALEVTSIHSVAGTLPPGCPLLYGPPFCGPHHTATKAAIVGGGSGIIWPGAASLAHRGVLFLDEAADELGTPEDDLGTLHPVKRLILTACAVLRVGSALRLRPERGVGSVKHSRNTGRRATEAGRVGCRPQPPSLEARHERTSGGRTKPASHYSRLHNQTVLGGRHQQA